MTGEKVEYDRTMIVVNKCWEIRVWNECGEAMAENNSSEMIARK